MHYFRPEAAYLLFPQTISIYPCILKRFQTEAFSLTCFHLSSFQLFLSFPLFFVSFSKHFAVLVNHKPVLHKQISYFSSEALIFCS